MERLFIFDFDGVIAFLFDDYDLSSAEREMADCLLAHGLDISDHKNIFTVSELIMDSDMEEDARRAALVDADRILSGTERDATGKAEAVPGFIEMLPALYRRGIRVAVASNNDPDAVRLFLDQKFPGKDIPVFGRDPMHPEHLKPSPYMLEKAMEHYSADKAGTVFFGDALSDMKAAERAGVGFYGFRSSEKNRKRFNGILPDERLLETWYDLEKLFY